jgi:dethiobiotin synthetase
MAYQQKYLAHQRWAICKPLQSGTGDGEHYQHFFKLSQPPETLNPLRFQQPLAPPIAAMQEGKSIDLGLVWQALQTLQQSHDQVLVEGVGGLGSPLTRELTVADLARDWRLPTLLVIPIRLGAIGQAVAHVALARQAGLTLRGIVLNCVEPSTADQIASWAPIDLLQSLTQVPVLGTVLHIEGWTNLERLAEAAAQLNLEQLLPKVVIPTAISGV